MSLVALVPCVRPKLTPGQPASTLTTSVPFATVWPPSRLKCPADDEVACAVLYGAACAVPVTRTIERTAAIVRLLRIGRGSLLESLLTLKQVPTLRPDFGLRSSTSAGLRVARGRRLADGVRRGGNLELKQPQPVAAEQPLLDLLDEEYQVRAVELALRPLLEGEGGLHQIPRDEVGGPLLQRVGEQRAVRVAAKEGIDGLELAKQLEARDLARHPVSLERGLALALDHVAQAGLRRGVAPLVERGREGAQIAAEVVGDLLEHVLLQLERLLVGEVVPAARGHAILLLRAAFGFSSGLGSGFSSRRGILAARRRQLAQPRRGRGPWPAGACRRRSRRAAPRRGTRGAPGWPRNRRPRGWKHTGCPGAAPPRSGRRDSSPR